MLNVIHIIILLGKVLQSFSQINVLSPHWLVDEIGGKGRIEGSTAAFGAPFFGDRIMGQLVWSESLHGLDHCKHSDYDVPSNFDKSVGPKRRIKILMVRRGKCSFVTKVKIASDKGAHAVIIVDKPSSALTSNDVKRIIVADDGYGDAITIPSILISNREGELLIAAARKSNVILEFEWAIPSSQIPRIDFWMSSGSRGSMAFMKDLALKLIALDLRLHFEPHFNVFSMPRGEAISKAEESLCWDADLHFCTEQPDGLSVTGRDVLQEDLRQLCLADMSSEKYWAYMQYFGDRCLEAKKESNYRFGEMCSHSLMRAVGIEARNIERITNCAESEVAAKLNMERSNTAWSPRALRINGWRYTGTLDADLVIRAICASFVKPPIECQMLFNPASPQTVPTPAPEATHTKAKQLKDIFGDSWEDELADVLNFTEDLIHGAVNDREVETSKSAVSSTTSTTSRTATTQVVVNEIGVRESLEEWNLTALIAGTGVVAASVCAAIAICAFCYMRRSRQSREPLFVHSSKDHEMLENNAGASDCMFETLPSKE